MMYCFYQTDGKGVWHLALASERHNLVKTKGAKLISALDVDNDFSTQLTAEEQVNVKQLGDLFFDFDEDLGVCIEQFKKFLVLLQSKNVALNQCRMYATGGRGFHCFIPMKMFMPKVNPTGVANLVHIYKEMAHSLHVESMDLRVYSSKKGRQLRCPNVERENGKFKVQITPDEALSMTEEKYQSLCSSMRNELPVEQAEFNPDLGLLYATAQDKVAKAVVRRKARKPDTDLLKRFNSEWPETFSLILNGVGLREDAGWNHISLQLAIAAAALGKTENQLIVDAQPLLQSHGGDSSRYNTPGKRERDLRDMYAYMQDNPCFDFAPGPILALLIPEVRANSDLTWGEWQPDPKPAKKPKATPVAGETSAELTVEGGTPETPAAETVVEDEDEEEDEAPVDGKLQISRNGIFFKTEDGYRNVCDMGLLHPISMRKLNGEHIGYEVDAFLDGKDLGKKFLPMSSFTSKSQFNNWSLTYGASMRASDTQTASLSDHFRRNSKKAPVYAVEREGIDVITPPGAKKSTDIDVIWASPEGVVTVNKEINYRYHGIYSAQGTYKSDLMSAPPLTIDDEDYISSLLQINTPGNVAKLLGWFSAAFLTQLIRKKFKRFPSVQVFGQAGAGKSMTVILLNHMNYHMAEPKQFSVAGQTMFPIIVAVATSASIPLVFEEVKSRQLTKTAKDFLQNILRSNYTADTLQRGSLGRDKTVREPTVTEFANAAPIVFVGEAIEDQSAILERCVVIALSKADQKGTEVHFQKCMDDPTRMGRLGKHMAMKALGIDREKLADELSKNFKQVSGLVQAAMIDGASRPAFNLAVTLTGLEFLRMNLTDVFGDKFDARIQELKDSILNNVSANIPKNMAEASRVIDTMAHLSRNSDVRLKLQDGVDYTTSTDGTTMDLKLRTAYAKYVRYQRDLGMEVLFDSENAFITAMANYGGTVRRACPDNNALYDSPKAVIYRLDLKYLEREGVDAFK